MKSLPTPINNSRVGFHYFHDSFHFREIDLVTWMPKVKQLNGSWLILEADQDRAIPESFITSLLTNNIEPIIHFNLNLSAPTILGRSEIIT